MKIIDNKVERFGDELKEQIKIGDKCYIASAVFSMYGFKELKTQLDILDEFKFIFTNPTFIKKEKEEKEEKEKPECITPYLEYEINTIANRAFLDTFWIESIQMNLTSNKIQKTPLEIANLGTHYANQLRADGEDKISMKTFKFRFSRWVLKFLKNINDENKTKSYNITKQAWRNGIDGEALPEGSYSGGVF